MNNRLGKNRSKLYPDYKWSLAIVSDNFPTIRAKAIAKGLFVGEGPDYQGTIYSNNRDSLKQFLLSVQQEGCESTI